MTPADRFHAHLDLCARCRYTPFDLCAEGRVIVRRAARAPRVPRPREGSVGSWGHGSEAEALVAALEPTP